MTEIASSHNFRVKKDKKKKKNGIVIAPKYYLLC